MKYTKNEFIGGSWVKGSEVQSGIKCRLASDTKRVESQFKNKDGSVKYQDVAQIVFEGFKEPLNISLNRPTLNALIDAFGEESEGWKNKILTAVTEKVRVGGKAVVAVYLLPDGYEKVDDANGYAIIVKSGTKVGTVNEDEPPF